jgi:predicted RNA-binding protein (virulence factor B family)
MIQIGQFHQLKIHRTSSVGLFLTDGTHDILLPNKYMPSKFELGDVLEVFVYLDHEERPVATTIKPYIKINDFAYLKVMHINKFGAFLDWGLEKNIFAPFAEQAQKMELNKRYLVYLFEDEKTERLVVSSKISKFLNKENNIYNQNEAVEIIVMNKSDLGYNVIINNKDKGLLYYNDIDEALRIGDKHKAFIKNMRDDKKIDVSFNLVGVESIEPNSQKILEELKKNKGVLKINDNSHAEEIKSVVNMSKKSFKKAVGLLYKSRQIRIEEDGIYLV